MVLKKKKKLCQVKMQVQAQYSKKGSVKAFLIYEGGPNKGQYCSYDVMSDG